MKARLTDLLHQVYLSLLLFFKLLHPVFDPFDVLSELFRSGVDFGCECRALLFFASLTGRSTGSPILPEHHLIVILPQEVDGVELGEGLRPRHQLVFIDLFLTLLQVFEPLSFLFTREVGMDLFDVADRIVDREVEAVA
jgi:hypothetical protein